MKFWEKWFMRFKLVIEDEQDTPEGKVHVRVVIKASSPALFKEVVDTFKPIHPAAWERAKGTR